jgi:geranylgeranyl diphosphate synthase, type II
MPVPMTNKERLGFYAAELEAYFQTRLMTALSDDGAPETLLEAMKYSLMAGGKRLRPALCMIWAEMLGSERSDVMPFAAGFEMIHTYSLIHDDLPAMDDDDLRRGKPSNHKKFGEAAAILAGDALLTEAFGVMAHTGKRLEAPCVINAVAEAVRAAGSAGMVGGQMLDMEYTGRGGVTLEELAAMQAKKTGALITASCVCGAILSGAGEADVDRARRYGAAIGAAFQIVDDILDVVGDEAALGKPVGSDEDQGKATYPALAGLDQSRRMAQARVDVALSCLEPYSGEHAGFLRDLAQYIVDRAY